MGHHSLRGKYDVVAKVVEINTEITHGNQLAMPFLLFCFTRCLARSNCCKTFHANDEQMVSARVLFISGRNERECQLIS